MRRRRRRRTEEVETQLGNMNVIQYILIENRSYLGPHNENPFSRKI